MEHLLSNNNGKEGGVEHYKGVFVELREILENEYDRIRKAKEVKENKRKCSQIMIAMNTNPFPLFSSSTVGARSSSQPLRASEVATLNSL